MSSESVKLKPQNDWSVLKISQSYEHAALEAERYLMKCKERAKTRDGYKKLHDEHVAKYYLYNYLHGRTFLESSGTLWSELNRLLSSPPSAPSECFDRDWFTTCYLSYVRGAMRGLEAA